MRRSELLFGDDDFVTLDFGNFLQDVQIPGDHLQEVDDALQARFFQKNPDGSPRERWELSEVQVSCPLLRFRRHLWLCGFYAPTIPSLWAYTRMGWPGALLTRVSERLDNAIEAWETGVRWERNVVFGGKRTLMPDKEGPGNVLKIQRPKFRLTPQDVRAIPADMWPKTELEMMQWLWTNCVMPEELRTLPTEFVDAPMTPVFDAATGQPSIDPATGTQKMARPTTEDTIIQHLEGSPSPGSYLIFSGAPYGMAQDEAFWTLLGPQRHTVETVGHGAPDLPVEMFMREMAGCVHRIRAARSK